MAELVWGSIGQRYFESGVDRGVLFPNTGPGVAWNGILSVNEKPSGGDPIPFYADGYKYLNLSSAEEYAANIEAFSAPAEFAVCDGTQSILNGLFITQQRRESFGFSYRTGVGSDSEGTEHGYKIHIVYDALASPATKNHRTIGGSPSPLVLSWEITTTPPAITGYRPSAHFVIDSRITPSYIMSILESILYGTDISESYLPSVSELIDVFNTPSDDDLFDEDFGEDF